MRVWFKLNKLLATSETPYYLYVKGILLYEKKAV